MNSQTYNWLIYEHLIHNCYSETASAFGSSCHLGFPDDDADRMDTDDQPQQSSPAFQSIDARKSILQLIILGNIKDAVDICNREFPNSLNQNNQKSRYMTFLLECQQFIEFLRESSTKAFQYAQEELGKYATGDPKFKDYLQDVISLIAYADLSSSPVCKLTSQERREDLANELNSYILDFENLASQTGIERIVRQVTVLKEIIVEEAPKEKKLKTAVVQKQQRWDFHNFLGEASV